MRYLCFAVYVLGAIALFASDALPQVPGPLDDLGRVGMGTAFAVLFLMAGEAKKAGTR